MTAKRTYYVSEASPAYPVSELAVATKKPSDLSLTHTVRASSVAEARQLVRDRLNTERAQSLPPYTGCFCFCCLSLRRIEQSDVEAFIRDGLCPECRKGKTQPPAAWSPNGDGVDHRLDYDPASPEGDRSVRSVVTVENDEIISVVPAAGSQTDTPRQSDPATTDLPPADQTFLRRVYGRACELIYGRTPVLNIRVVRG